MKGENSYQETSGWGDDSTRHSNSILFPWTHSTLASWDLNTGRVAATNHQIQWIRDKHPSLHVLL